MEIHRGYMMNRIYRFVIGIQPPKQGFIDDCRPACNRGAMRYDEQHVIFWFSIRTLIETTLASRRLIGKTKKYNLHLASVILA